MAARSGPLKMGMHQITGLADGVDDNDAVNKGQMDTAISSVDLSGYAPLASPALTGNPTAPTPATADNDTSIATTAYVQSNLANYATLASPALTGNPTAPTPSTSDNDTSIATTAYVQANKVWTHIDKSANQTVTSSTTLTDDSALQFAMAANTTYQIMVCLVLSFTTGGYKYGITGPSSPTRVRWGSSSAYGSIVSAGTTGQIIAFATFLVENGANTGNFKIQFAESAATGSVTMEKGSWLEYRSI
jgi:hypothetical protein